MTWYINKKLGIKVFAESRKEAALKMTRLATMLATEDVVETTAMSNSKKQLETTIKSQTDNIITLWCLCWYLFNVENKGNLLNHEKGKLRDAILEIRKEKFNGKDRPDVKRKSMEKIWLKENKYDSDNKKVIDCFINKFKDEQIKKDSILYNKIASDFQKEIQTLITLSCDESIPNIRNYADNKFPCKPIRDNR